MKSYVILILLLLCTGVSHAQEDTVTPLKDTVYVPEITTGPGIRIFEEVYDFGNITQGSGVQHELYYMNIGSEPLVLTTIPVPCGSCMSIGWPKEPVLPGNKGMIVIYTARGGYTGSFDKTITIHSNAVNEPQKTVRIKATVVPEKD